MEYYFLDEDSLRNDNRFIDLDEATEMAAVVAYRRKRPIKIYKKWPNNKYCHVRTVDTDEAFEILKSYEGLKERIK